MTARATITKTELQRLAALATAKNVQVEIERGGTIIRVSPNSPAALVDDDEAEIDRELQKLKARHGFV